MNAVKTFKGRLYGPNFAISGNGPLLTGDDSQIHILHAIHQYVKGENRTSLSPKCTQTYYIPYKFVITCNSLRKLAHTIYREIFIIQIKISIDTSVVVLFVLCLGV